MDGDSAVRALDRKGASTVSSERLSRDREGTILWHHIFAGSYTESSIDMQVDRRLVLKGIGGALALPLLETGATAAQPPTTRFLVVGNPLGMHPGHFFPTQFGETFPLPKTLRSLEWLRGRFTILSHTDHAMNNGHGRETSFLNGILPENNSAYPERNISVDQVMARRTYGRVRFPSVHAALRGGIRMSWNANGVDLKPFTDPQGLFDHLFLNLTDDERAVRRELIVRNRSILDTVGEQLSSLRRRVGRRDRERLDQYATSIRELEGSLVERSEWIDRDRPKFDISHHLEGPETTIANRYGAIFDMIAYAFETDLTRVATVAFPNELSYADIEGVTRGYHACTHNGKKEAVIAELVAIESFQIAQLSRCLRKLDAVREPGSDGTLLDRTMVLFGSGMGYGGTHSNRNLPILVAGGGFRHRGHVDARGGDGINMPLCNLYVTLLQRFGVERDRFNTSTGAFELQHA